jgi:hypothetical protein
MIILALAVPFRIVITAYGAEASRGADVAYRVAVSFLVATAVDRDRSSRKVRMPLEFSAFMLFLWPFLLPYYLFTTRRWRGLALALGVWMAVQIPTLTAVATDVYLESTNQTVTVHAPCNHCSREGCPRIV